MDPLTFPWLKYPNEDLKSFRMFESYLKMQARSYQSLAGLYLTSKRKISIIAKKFDWVHRAELYDKHSTDEIKYRYKAFTDAKLQLKFENRIELSSLCLGLLQQVKFYLENFKDIYDNPVAIRQLRTMREIIRTIKQIYSVTDFSLDYSGMNAKIIRNIDFEKFSMPLLESHAIEIKQEIAPESENNSESTIEQYQSPAIYELVSSINEQSDEVEFDINKFLAKLREQDEDSEL